MLGLCWRESARNPPFRFLGPVSATVPCVGSTGSNLRGRRGTPDMTSRFSSVQQTLEAVRAGRLVIIVDAEDRENEGDFFMAAEKVTPEMVYLMLACGCGQLCVPVSWEIANRLKLKPLVQNNTNPDGTAFAV